MMPYLCVREARRRAKHRMDDISFEWTVSQLKERTSAMVDIPASQQNLIYGGQILRDNKSLISYGVKDGCTVHIVRKLFMPEPIEQDKENVSVENVMNVLEAAIKSPAYRSTVEKILSNPEMLEQLVAATPGLSDDPVAMTLLQDRELLQQVIETADIEKVVKEHPSLVQAASYIAAAAASDHASSSVAAVRMADEEMRDMDPGLIAQAEMVAAHEERIQQSQTARGQAVTPSMLALALASAGMPTTGTARPSRDGASTSGASPSGAGPSGLNLSTPTTSGSSSASNSAGTSSQVTRDLFSQAMSAAIGSGASSTQLTESQLQSQLQQLRDMGITDDEASLRALRSSGGDVQGALELIFGGT